MIDSFKKYICSNCKAECNRGIVLVNYNGIKQARCVDYEKKEELQGYKKANEITANRSNALMRLNL